MNSTWRGYCPASWPAWARRWAGTKGSLTKALVGLGKGFEVVPISQGQGLVNHPADQPLAVGRAGMPARYRLRVVRLRVGGETVVLARSVMQVRGAASDWPFWSGLGNRSLGSRLFSDPSVKRGRVHYARIPANRPWLAMAKQGDGVTGLGLSGLSPRKKRWDKPIGFGTMSGSHGKPVFNQHPQAMAYARCACFRRGRGMTALWVVEVFLPTLQQFNRDSDS